MTFAISGSLWIAVTVCPVCAILTEWQRFDRSKYEFELDQVSGRGGGGHSIERYQIFG